MYYHVVENSKRNGKPVYVKVATYQSWYYLSLFVVKHGKPVWILRTQNKDLFPLQVGGGRQQYWNSGAGWQWGEMPVLFLHQRF